jgi:hypothetical protein
LLLVAVAATSGVLYGGAPAGASSCRSFPWWQGGSELESEDPYEWRASAPSDPVPVDARLWQLLTCDDEPEPCSFVTPGHVVTVDREPVTGCTERRRFGYFVELVPRDLLLAGRTYANHCVPGLPTFTTREGPAAPPEPVAVAAVGLDRGLDAPCSRGERLDLVLDDIDAAYLREGGRIELGYPEGHVLPVTEKTYGYGEGFPASDGPITLTPVAADGTRGETVRFDKIRYNQAVLLLCAVGEQGSWQALWSLVPIAWVFASRRRRSR